MHQYYQHSVVYQKIKSVRSGRFNLPDSLCCMNFWLLEVFSVSKYQKRCDKYSDNDSTTKETEWTVCADIKCLHRDDISIKTYPEKWEYSKSLCTCVWPLQISYESYNQKHWIDYESNVWKWNSERSRKRICKSICTRKCIIYITDSSEEWYGRRRIDTLRDFVCFQREIGRIDDRDTRKDNDKKVFLHKRV